MTPSTNPRRSLIDINARNNFSRDTKHCSSGRNVLPLTGGVRPHKTHGIIWTRKSGTYPDEVGAQLSYFDVVGSEACAVVYTFRADPLLTSNSAVLPWLVKVLDTKGSSYASDVYSFGVVVWEVLTRETPWAGVCLRDIYVHMVIKEDRLNIPTESPTRLAIVMNACWARVPEERPTFSKITRWLSWE